MPLGDKINVALREQNCQKIGSERVKLEIILVLFIFSWKLFRSSELVLQNFPNFAISITWSQKLQLPKTRATFLKLGVRLRIYTNPYLAKPQEDNDSRQTPQASQIISLYLDKHTCSIILILYVVEFTNT